MDRYRLHYDQAMRYIELSLFADGITELNEAIETARQNKLEQEYFQASIDLAETMRKTRDFKRGAQILLGLNVILKYPHQEVRRLGRLAAIYHETHLPGDRQQYDSVFKYLKPAMALAESNGFELELAGLKNEWGYLVGNNFGRAQSIPHHLEAADLFLKNNDRQNYVGAMTKVLSYYILEAHNIQKADSIIPILLKEVENTNWYTSRNQLYEYVAEHAIQNKNDSLSYYRWRVKGLLDLLKYTDAVHSNQLDNLRVQHETLEFQAEAEISSRALTIKEAQNKKLAIYLTILGAMILVTGFLFYKERVTKRAKTKLNEQLKVANEKYQMLMVESNHRIKNNLQMIISMLEYTGKDLNPSNTRALKRMSGKIHTISALHKHLYTDAHNEKVHLNTYFKEIISLYLQLSPDNLEVFEHFDTISIPSERLVYFGLIFNEMLSNTVEHNAHDVKQVHISTTRHNEVFTFEYRDDSEHKMNRPEGIGSLLIRQLINRVGGQNLEFDPSIGRYQFQFHE